MTIEGDDIAIENVYLHAGQIVVSGLPCIITTIVGSCVAFYLYDPVRRAGGGSHYVLPVAGISGFGSARFGDVAIPQLIRRTMALGCCEEDLRAKLFGGASTLETSESLGMRNVRLARRLLESWGIEVIAEDVGGTQGRKIAFRTDTGDAWVRKL